MKQLTEIEMETLAALMKRAIANSQVNLAVAVPYADLGLVNDGEFGIDDTHSGTGASSDSWLVDTAQASGDEPTFDEAGNEGEWRAYERPELTIYVPQDTFGQLAGERENA